MITDKSDNSDQNINIYDEIVNLVDRYDYWAQVKRTVNGVPVDETQIEMIVQTISSELQVNSQDFFLDLGCGNGALSNEIFHGHSGIGIDSSMKLIEIAKSDFGSENITFWQGDLVSFCRNLDFETAQRVTLVLIYGVASYLTDSEIQEVIQSIEQSMPNVRKVYVGNLPLLERRESFFGEKIPTMDSLKDAKTPLGVWRSRGELSELFSSNYFSIEFLVLPIDFYASHYRCDLVLTRLRDKRGVDAID